MFLTVPFLSIPADIYRPECDNLPGLVRTPRPPRIVVPFIVSTSRHNTIVRNGAYRPERHTTRPCLCVELRMGCLRPLLRGM